MIELFGDDEEALTVYWLSMTTSSVYWFFGMIFFSFNFIPYFKKFKHQPNEKVDFEKVFKVGIND